MIYDSNSSGRRRGLRLCAAFFACVAAACHRAAPHDEILEGRLGTYSFFERIAPSGSSTVVTFEGHVTIIGDTITMDARPGPCIYNRRRTDETTIYYECSDFVVRFDRSRPLTSAYYTVVLTVNQTQRDCGPGSPSQSRCSATTRSITEQKSVTQSGKLTLKPAS